MFELFEGFALASVLASLDEAGLLARAGGGGPVRRRAARAIADRTA